MSFELLNQYCSDCLRAHLLCYSGKKSWENLYLIHEVLEVQPGQIVFTLDNFDGLRLDHFVLNNNIFIE
jgi:hypothetical protein